MNEQDVLKKYIGVPYVLHGRSINDGLDCWGLILCIYKDLGFELWDINAEYDERWSWEGKNHFIDNYHHDWRLVIEPKLFDVILLSNSKSVPNHAGIVLTGNRILHTCRAGTVISYYEGKMRKNFCGFYRLRAYENTIYKESA